MEIILYHVENSENVWTRVKRRNVSLIDRQKAVKEFDNEEREKERTITIVFVCA